MRAKKNIKDPTHSEVVEFLRQFTVPMAGHPWAAPLVREGRAWACNGAVMLGIPLEGPQECATGCGRRCGLALELCPDVPADRLPTPYRAIRGELDCTQAVALDWRLLASLESKMLKAGILRSDEHLAIAVAPQNQASIFRASSFDEDRSCWIGGLCGLRQTQGGIYGGPIGKMKYNDLEALLPFGVAAPYTHPEDR